MEAKSDPGATRASLKLRSTVQAGGTLRLSLDRMPIMEPGSGEVLVRMEVAPIHPADIMVTYAGADIALARQDGPAALVAPLSKDAQRASAGRVGLSLEVGLEGAGTVIAAGDGSDIPIGARVALLAPRLGAFAEYCTVPAASCMVLPTHIDFRQGASAFTNPLTALAMVETLHQTGETAMVHTAAASHIGQMLVRICAEDGIGLVNIVRRKEQAELLTALGAEHVCDISAPDFSERLAHALAVTGARVAFDAIGGGETASILLEAMEAAAAGRMNGFGAYGSSEMKRVYLYGRLDRQPTIIPPGSYGMRWSIEGWAMPPVLDRAGEHRRAALLKRIAEGLDTTFGCSFGGEVTLSQMLEPSVVQNLARQRTGGKRLLVIGA